jgi:hypothetical protein
VWLAFIGVGLSVTTDSPTVFYVIGGVSLLVVLGAVFMELAFPALVPRFELLPAGTEETRAER